MSDPDLKSLLEKLTEVCLQNQDLQKEQQAQQKALQDLVKTVTAKPIIAPPKLNASTNDNKEFLLESLANTMVEFHYDPDSDDGLFDVWYSRYADTFSQDACKLDDASKVRLLLRKLDTRAHSRYANFILPKKPKDNDFEESVTKLKEIFSRRTSLFNKRCKCLQFIKPESDDFIAYAGAVNRLCEDFKLSSLKENEFKALIFVCGLRSHRDSEIRTRLLSKLETDAATLTVDTLATECQRLLNLKQDTALIENAAHSSTSVVNSLSDKYRGKSNQKRQDKPQQKQKSDARKTPKSPCWLCGGVHYTEACPFVKHVCKECKQIGHKDGYCAFARPSGKPQRSSVKEVSSDQTSARRRRKFVSILINGKPIKLQIDTASDITVISRDNWLALGSPATRPTSHEATSASGGHVKLEAEFECSVTLQDSCRSTVCYVAPNSNLNLLGLDLIDAFDLWSVPLSSVCNRVTVADGVLDQVHQLQRKFPEVFLDTLGLCTKTKVKLFLKPNQQPVYVPRRPVAQTAYEPLQDELRRLENLGIISFVEHSDWAAPIVAVRKANGSIRICGDYSTGLNNALQPNDYPLPVPDDIFASLAGMRHFSIIDLSNAYLQIEMDEDSKNLLTVNTHRGLFKFNRLAPGVRPATGAFQKIMDSMTAGLTGVRVYLDDILVGGATEEEHLHNLHAVLERIRDYGFHLQLSKCRFFMDEIKYLGHVVNSSGIRPDPAKLQAISTMPPPKNVPELRSYLGAVNYYAKFVSEMHRLRHPMDQLLKANAQWNWTKDCQRAFEEFKRLLSSDLLLTHFDPRHEIIVAADASNTGIGACLMHRLPTGAIKVVQHRSRSLTPAEKNYGQIEKEGLALVFGVMKFHSMIYGRHFTLQTDHKPLLSIFGSHKGIPVHSANRLQRWAIILLTYDFRIEYIATDQFGYADVLSRLISQHSREDD